MPKFSIIIPVYNKEKHLKKTLQSVLEQTYVDFEILLINDGSTDSSEAIIKSFNDARIQYYSQNNQGVSAARNLGIQKATAPYIAFLDADDIWQNDHLILLENSIKQYPKQSVYANAKSIHKNNKKLVCKYSIKSKKNLVVVDYFEASMLTSILHSSTFAVKKEVFDQTGNYNINYSSGEDTDLYVRIGYYYKVVFNQTTTTTYFASKDGLKETSTSLQNKAKFEEYSDWETQNIALRKFIDNNRFALSIIAKLDNDKKNHAALLSKIALDNLNTKQRFLIHTPQVFIKIFIQIKGLLEKLGIQLSAYK